MHYNRHYDTDSPCADLQAFEDMRDWFDDDAKFNELLGTVHTYMREGGKGGFLRVCFSLAGIQGYPVTAFINRYYPEHSNDS